MTQTNHTRYCRCNLCGDHMGLTTTDEFRNGVCCECTAQQATPRSLRDLADWFDSPQHTPSISVPVEAIARPATPGMLLRAIADAVEAAE